MKNNETGDIIMRRLLSVVMVSAMVISLAACSSSGTDSENAGGQASSAEAGAVQETSRENGDVTADDGQAGEGGQDEPLKIAFFMFENSNTFTTYIRKGLESYGKENNVTVDSFDGKSDQSTQTDAITTALAKGEYDLIVVNPVDSGAGTTINNLCRDNNVPVIFADRAPDLVGGVLDEYEQSYYVGLSVCLSVCLSK